LHVPGLISAMHRQLVRQSETHASPDIAARLRAHGAEFLGEVAQYESIFLLCYLRGPAGIIVALAEQPGCRVPGGAAATGTEADARACHTAMYLPGSRPDSEHAAEYPGAPAPGVLLLLHDFPDPGNVCKTAGLDTSSIRRTADCQAIVLRHTDHSFVRA
jgi:hypothetical protein